MTSNIKWLAWLVAGLVFILAILAFVLSYSSLQHMALSYGVGPRLSYVWPLLLDFAMLVFSMAILRANLRNEPALYPWGLTIGFSGLATVANVLDITSLGIPPVVIGAAVKALAPLALVLAFELLMSMLKAELKRADVAAGIRELLDERDALVVRRDRLTGDVDALTDKVDALKLTLRELRKDKRQLTGPGRPAGATIGPARIEEARSILRQRGLEITGAELGRLLGVSKTTGNNIKKQLAPEFTNGKGGKIQ